MSCLVLLTGTTYGFSPLYRLEKNSPVLKQLGFELHSERTRTGEVSCQVIFDENAIDLPKWGVTISVISDPSEDLQTTTLFASSHTLGHFTDFGSGSDGLTKRFGFQFKLGSQFIKDAFINFYMGVPKTHVPLLGSALRLIPPWLARFLTFPVDGYFT